MNMYSNRAYILRVNMYTYNKNICINVYTPYKSEKQRRRRVASCQNKTGIWLTHLLSKKSTSPFKCTIYMLTTTFTKLYILKARMSMHNTHASSLRRTCKHAQKPLHVGKKHRLFYTNTCTHWDIYTKRPCLKPKNETGMQNKVYSFPLHVLLQLNPYRCIHSRADE